MKNYLVGEPGKLPVLTDGIDAVLLPHTLDFCLDPQKVLLEVERVLIPEGKVIISGFNPVSLWGVVKTLKRKKTRVPWNAHFVSYTRLHDWLSLLGFDVEQTEVMMFRPPLENKAMMDKLEFMETTGSRVWPRFGGVYLIKAVKRVSTLTPIKPMWKRRPRLLSHVVEPTTRGFNRDKTG
jgi:ubiquinone/menaquinone biosynthesis C-methylase UbiE